MGDFYFAVLAGMLFIASTLFHITKPKGPVWWDGKGQTVSQVFFLYLDGVFSLAFGFLCSLASHHYGVFMGDFDCRVRLCSLIYGVLAFKSPV